MSDSVRPHRWQSTRFPHPWDSQGKNTEVGCHFLLQCMKGKVKVKSLSHVWLLATPWTAAYQAPSSMGFSRREYWSGLPLPSPNCALEYYKYFFSKSLWICFFFKNLMHGQSAYNYHFDRWIQYWEYFFSPI